MRGTKTGGFRWQKLRADRVPCSRTAMTKSRCCSSGQTPEPCLGLIREELLWVLGEGKAKETSRLDTGLGGDLW